MAKTTYRDKQSEVRINERYAKVVDLLNKGWTEYKIAKEVGVSQPQISRDLQVIVAQWRESYINKIDIVQAKEIARLEHLMAAHWEEFEISKYRDVPEKRDKKGKVIVKAHKKRVVANTDILAQILEVWKQIAKIYGIAQDINVSATQNNLSVGSSSNAPLGSPGSISAENFPWQLLFGKPAELADPGKDPIEAEIARVLGESSSAVQLPDYPNKVPLEEVERNGDQ